MRNLSSLPGGTIGHFDNIVEAKHPPRRRRLNRLRSQIVTQYVVYPQWAPDLEEIQALALSNTQKADLLHCYDSETAPLGKLMVDIRNHICIQDALAGVLCQYCGLSYDTTTFDHYLPKESFAEFSTLSLNLVPCCERCNALKGTVWLDERGNRRIISFYFDTLPNRQFLYADVSIDNVPAAKFRLSTCPEDFCGIETIITSHFQKLELLTRFSLAATEQFAEVKFALKPVVNAQGMTAAVSLLNADIQKFVNTHSLNFWKVALFQAIVANPDFISKLIQL